MIRGGLVALFLLVPGLAQADAISPPPTECPHGGTPSGSHSGPVCVPVDCTTDATCAARETCREVALCITEEACGGDRPPGDVCAIENVVGRCEGGASCARGGSCRTMRICTAPGSGGGGCSAGRGTGPLPILLALLGLGLWRTTRR